MRSKAQEQNENPDGYWLDAIRKGSYEEQNIAAQKIVSKYQPILVPYLATVMPEDWTADVMQEIWLAFFQYTGTTSIKEAEGGARILWKIAQRKRADAVRTLMRRRKYESDTPLTDLTKITDDSRMPEVENVIRRGANNLAFLFSHTVFDDIERIILLLTKGLHFPSRVVARLLGKTEGTVNQVAYIARKRLRDYCESDFYKLEHEANELKGSIFRPKLQYWGHMYELFEHINPKLTPEEIYSPRHGINPNRLRDASLVFEWNEDTGKLLTLYLLVNFRGLGDGVSNRDCLLEYVADHPEMILKGRLPAQYLSQPPQRNRYNPYKCRHLVAPEYIKLSVNVQGNDILVKEGYFLQLALLHKSERYTYGHSPSWYLTSHSPIITVEVSALKASSLSKDWIFR